MLLRTVGSLPEMTLPPVGAASSDDSVESTVAHAVAHLSGKVPAVSALSAGACAVYHKA
ncbi:hypothetical protein KIH77_06355 [Bifidobacterium sp. 82T24]|uniref:hypothetical protein n=1 Tax=Bifidobacterium pluvialisilvae TaxID=2834436 RepID=UPI001C5899A1|nr:hypothetical protein [Bifidobacterium pluvialisilvae]MBW3088350.1 hypothetical protein [Bifidobacterium pluvialisilvae]